MLPLSRGARSEFFTEPFSGEGSASFFRSTFNVILTGLPFLLTWPACEMVWEVRLNRQLMQRTSFFGRSMAPGQTSGLLTNEKYTLNVALVYMDRVTREWAEQVRGRLEEVVGAEAVHCTAVENK
jgi:hypothetical protein